MKLNIYNIIRIKYLNIKIYNIQYQKFLIKENILKQ